MRPRRSDRAKSGAARSTGPLRLPFGVFPSWDAGSVEVSGEAVPWAATRLPAAGRSEKLVAVKARRAIPERHARTQIDTPLLPIRVRRSPRAPIGPPRAILGAPGATTVARPSRGRPR